MTAFRLPDPPCYAEPHVHIEAPERGLRHQARVGRDFHGFDGYRRALILRWHGIEEYPSAEFADLAPDPVILRRLQEYVALREVPVGGQRGAAHSPQPARPFAAHTARVRTSPVTRSIA